MNNNSGGAGGLGLCAVVQIVFIVLKLTKLINWSWPVVLIPLWVDLGASIILLTAYVILTIKARKK